MIDARARYRTAARRLRNTDIESRSPIDLTFLLFISVTTIYAYSYTILYIATSFVLCGHHQIVYVSVFIFVFLLFSPHIGECFKIYMGVT
jgi:hypothetical protein